VACSTAFLAGCGGQEEQNQSAVPVGEVETLQPKTAAHDDILINEVDSTKIDSLNALKEKSDEAKKDKGKDKPSDNKPKDKPKPVKDKGNGN